jgi:hypothetical protein
MGFIVRDCVRCGTKSVQHSVSGSTYQGENRWELFCVCNRCTKSSIYVFHYGGNKNPHDLPGQLGDGDYGQLDNVAVKIATTSLDLAASIPERIAGLFREANECRQMTWYEAAGAMYRKTVDVATKHIYATDGRLTGKIPADALRVRIKSLGEMKILEPDIVEVADVAALDGNDAAHDIDPYTADEAEALEYLTMDLLDRLFVRPARLAEVRAKQILAGQRKPA